MEEGDFLSERTLNDWLSRIRTGERGIEVDQLSRQILRDFYLRNFEGVPQSRVVMSWIADVFSKVMEHEDANELLGLLPRPSNRPVSEKPASEDVAWWVALAMKRGHTKTEAVLLAAEVFARNEKSVERDCKQNAESVAGMNADADWEAYFLVRKRPLPAPADDKPQKGRIK